MASTAFLHAATHALARELPHVYRNFIHDIKAEDIEEIINVHALGAAVLANISGTAISLVGGTVLATALSFTGIGNVLSSVIMAGLDYAVVMVSGVIYLKLLVGLFKAGKDPQRMSADDLSRAAADVVKQENVGQMVKDAQGAYKQARRSGEATGKETVELEKD